MDWYHDRGINSYRCGGVGGYCNVGVGGVSIFIIGDDGSSFFILLTPFGLHSWFLQMSPNSPNSAFLINSLFNQTNFSFLSVSLLNSFALAKSFLACLWFSNSSWVKSLCPVEPCGQKNYHWDHVAMWRNIVESRYPPGRIEVPWGFVELFSSLNVCSLKGQSGGFEL